MLHCCCWCCCNAMHVRRPARGGATSTLPRPWPILTSLAPSPLLQPAYTLKLTIMLQWRLQKSMLTSRCVLLDGTAARPQSDPIGGAGGSQVETATVQVETQRTSAPPEMECAWTAWTGWTGLNGLVWMGRSGRFRLGSKVTLFMKNGSWATTWSIRIA